MLDPEGAMFELAKLPIKLDWGECIPLGKYTPDPKMAELTRRLRDAFREEFEREALSIIQG